MLEASGGALLAAPLVRRCRYPLVTLALVVAGTPLFLQFALSTPAYVLPLMVSLYTVAAHGSRRRTVAVAGLTPIFALFVAGLFSPDDGSILRQVLEEVSQFGLALALGEAVRSQRAAIAAIRERDRREHELEARRQVNEERVRIARDVHDVVAHSIATINTQAAVGVYVAREDPDRAVGALEAIKEVSAHALDDLRHALGIVRGPARESPTRPTASVQGVPSLLQGARSAGLPVTLRMQGSASGLPSSVQVAIYRVVQEGLTNVMRHASGAQTEVRISVGDREVVVEVVNDRAGSPTVMSEAGSGSGLVGLRERARAIGGKLDAEQEVEGFRLRATLPLDREPA